VAKLHSPVRTRPLKQDTELKLIKLIAFASANRDGRGFSSSALSSEPSTTQDYRSGQMRSLVQPLELDDQRPTSN
jgi:hypothetical protein